MKRKYIGPFQQVTSITEVDNEYVVVGIQTDLELSNAEVIQAAKQGDKKHFHIVIRPRKKKT